MPLRTLLRYDIAPPADQRQQAEFVVRPGAVWKRIDRRGGMRVVGNCVVKGSGRG